MPTTPVLTTARLRLRRLKLDDDVAMAGLLGDDHEAIQMTSHVPDPCTAPGARDWIAMRSGKDSYPFAIERDGVMVGVIGALVQDELAGLGYWIGRAHWGHGFATEAAEALLGYLASIGVRRVEADTFTGNAASARVLAKLGFAYVESADEEQPVRGGVRRIDRYVWLAAR